MPILRLVPPSAVVIEIVVARHFAGDILSGSRAVLFQVALLSPLVEPIRTGPVDDAVSGVFCPVKFCLLAGTHRLAEARSDDPQFPALVSDLRRLVLDHIVEEEMLLDELKQRLSRKENDTLNAKAWREGVALA